MHIRHELCSFTGMASKYLSSLTQVAHAVFELQIDKLRWLCMQQIIAAMNKKTVLEVIVVADAVTDTELMDVCMKFLLKSENS